MLIDKIRARIAAHEQVILLKNRRGFAHFLQCRACGHVPQCERCSVSLTFHKQSGRLVCHYCEHREGLPAECPLCHSRDLKPAGAGTERVEEELQKLLPEARLLRLDTDTAVRGTRAGRILDAFRAGEADVLIGTQMVSKGLDFPNVTLVGVVLADTGLFLPDFRSSERVFQLLTQVAGRCGRAEADGEVVLQTYAPDEKSIRHGLTQDYEAFYREELSDRRALSFPPFTRGVLVRFLSKEESSGLKAAERLCDLMASDSGIEVMGPSPSPLYKIRNLYRHFIYIKGKSSGRLHALLSSAFDRYGRARRGGVRIQVFFDPNSLL